MPQSSTSDLDTNGSSHDDFRPRKMGDLMGLIGLMIRVKGEGLQFDVENQACVDDFLNGKL